MQLLQETLPACCTPKVVEMETGEVKYEKVYASLRLLPKISLKHDWMTELGPEVAQRPDGQVVQQFESSQSHQLNPSPDHDDRTRQPVSGERPKDRARWKTNVPFPGDRNTFFSLTNC